MKGWGRGYESETGVEPEKTIIIILVPRSGENKKKAYLKIDTSNFNFDREILVGYRLQDSSASNVTFVV